MDAHSNPYASPVTGKVADNFPQSDFQGLDFVPIMRRWERLRILYNGILVCLVLFLTFFVFLQNVADLEYWVSVGFGGVIANLCFLTGPTIEAYGTHFRCWHGTFTTLLFLAGLGLTALLAFGCIATYPNI